MRQNVMDDCCDPADVALANSGPARTPGGRNGH